MTQKLELTNMRWCKWMWKESTLNMTFLHWIKPSCTMINFVQYEMSKDSTKESFFKFLLHGFSDMWTIWIFHIITQRVKRGILVL
jgi:hypothetical protein